MATEIAEWVLEPARAQGGRRRRLAVPRAGHGSCPRPRASECSGAPQVRRTPPCRLELGSTKSDSGLPPGCSAAYRGRVWVSWTVCWKVGRFWKGNGGRVMALASVERFWSKQLGCGLFEQSPCP